MPRFFFYHRGCFAGRLQYPRKRFRTKISFDNLLYPDICVTRLSCIEQNLNSIVNCTLQNLRSMIWDHSDGVSHLTPTKLILRDTTKQYLATAR